jgi:CRISPR-associated protein Cas5d
MRGPELLRPFYADDDRQQRASIVLRDVAYRIWAKPILTSGAASTDGLVKYVEMFRRRATHGQCVNQPYLGCREFACSFELVENSASRPIAIDESRDLGIMLYDLDFADAEMPQPLFFRAKLERGVLHVPKRDSAEVLS